MKYNFKMLIVTCITFFVFMLINMAHANQNIINNIKMLEKKLIEIEQIEGQHAKNLLPVITELTILTQKIQPKKSKKYNQRRTRLYLRHNSHDFVKQLKDVNLKTTIHAKNTLKKVKRVLKKNYKLCQTPHWTLVCPINDDAFVYERLIPELEKTYDASLSFLIALSLRNQPLKHKMTAIYFENRDDYIKYITHITKNDKLKKTRGIFSPNERFLAFYGMSEKQSENDNKKVLSTAIHEAVHQFMFTAGLQKNADNQPRWLTEGLASSFQPKDFNADYGPHVSNYSIKRMNGLKKHLKKHGTFPTLNDVITTSTDVAYESEYSNFYAYNMGSIIIKFLYAEFPDEFVNYIGLMAKAKPGRSAAHHRRLFKRAFGDPKKLEKRFSDFMMQAIESNS